MNVSSDNQNFAVNISNSNLGIESKSYFPEKGNVLPKKHESLNREFNEEEKLGMAKFPKKFGQNDVSGKEDRELVKLSDAGQSLNSESDVENYSNNS